MYVWDWKGFPLLIHHTFGRVTWSLISSPSWTKVFGRILPFPLNLGDLLWTLSIPFENLISMYSILFFSKIAIVNKYYIKNIHNFLWQPGNLSMVACYSNKQCLQGGFQPKIHYYTRQINNIIFRRGFWGNKILCTLIQPCQPITLS